ncbi:MAG: flavin reductase [Clostridia bacterium]|nr:flavin reductase [Clostridia bacterium]
MHEFTNIEQPLSNYLNSGAFLVSGDNVMTVSWGLIGVMWGKKVLVAPIRDTRYTKTFVDMSNEFTLSVPKANEMREQIAFCGSRSGRDVDKWKECNMTKQKAKEVSSFVVGGCDKYFECRVLTVVDMKDSDLSKIDKWYPSHDMHNFYFAEIVAEY